MEKLLKYYTDHGIMTEVKNMKHMVNGLPRDIECIVSTIQNIFLHQFWAERYGIKLTKEQKNEPLLRSVEEKLIHLQSIGYSHITQEKELKDKMISICRDFSVMGVALCREVGIPARARCGFATYFEKGKYIDHWVIEYWNEQENRWVIVDAQLDDLQKKSLDIKFNSLDISEDYFITGSKAWEMCRQGKANPELFGIFTWWGYDYLICNLLLDANSLLKIPMQPWDKWQGYKNTPISEWTEKDYLAMDQLAKYVSHVNNNFDDLYTYIQKNDKIKVPEDLNKVTIF
ncbi:transglutaminase-like domain-containing protein [Clostridiaceae bacterium M8S5]|nr:transglutaminase-like domain-containing protein [Clostridiaceae bacterium M8S5]